MQKRQNVIFFIPHPAFVLAIPPIFFHFHIIFLYFLHSFKILGRLYRCIIANKRAIIADNTDVIKNTQNAPNAGTVNNGRKLNITITS